VLEMGHPQLRANFDEAHIQPGGIPRNELR
jgi:hypothetical protein